MNRPRVGVYSKGVGFTMGVHKVAGGGIFLHLRADVPNREHPRRLRCALRARECALLALLLPINNESWELIGREMVSAWQQGWRACKTMRQMCNLVGTLDSTATGLGGGTHPDARMLPASQAVSGYAGHVALDGDSHGRTLSRSEALFVEHLCEQHARKL